MIQRELIRPDGEQPRRTFDEDKLVELAASIQANGIIQPLVVQFKPATQRLLEPELTDQRWRVVQMGTWEEVWADASKPPVLAFDLADWYQIIMGERRWRAAGMAGLKELPCVVRKVTEQDRFNWQFIENHQRENVTTLEEAEALQRQLDERAARGARASVEELAKELGMSRAALYERLKLNRLSLDVKDALRSGKISTSVAAVVATVPTTDAQEVMLKRLMDDTSPHFPWTVRDVQEFLLPKYLRQLDAAPFQQNRDDYAGPAVAAVACRECPNRTGNMLAEFPELKSRPNVCTVPSCYQGKCQAHFSERAEEFKAAGHVVTTMKAINADPVVYIKPTQWVSTVHDGCKPAKEIVGKHAPKTIIAVDEEGIHEFYASDEFKAAAKKAKVELYEPESVPAAGLSPAEYKEREEKELARRKAAEELETRKRAFVATLLPALAKALVKVKDAVAWEINSLLLLAFGYDEYGSTDDFEAALVKGVKSDKARTLGMLLATTQAHPVKWDGWEPAAIKAWQLAGVDVVAEWEKAEKSAQPSIALVAKKELAQAKLLQVTAGKGKAKKGKGKKF